MSFSISEKTGITGITDLIMSITDPFFIVKFIVALFLLAKFSRILWIMYAIPTRGA